MKKQSKRTGTPKNLQAIQTSRHLHVAPRHHTGHITPKHTTSYPVLVMIMLLIGVLMFSWTRAVKADQLTPPITNAYTVNASVVGTAPKKAPTITFPLSGAKFSRSIMTLTGTCQSNTYIVLTRNGAFSGVGLCEANGTYHIRTDLFVGANDLQTQIFSPTDQPGPLSSIQTVFYHPVNLPVVVPEQASTSSAPNTAASNVQVTNPLLFKTQYKFRGTYTDTPSKWVLSLEGGSPPYAISVNWGDGETELISKATAGSFEIEHTYHKAGAYKGSYYIEFSATDAQKSKTFLQLLAIINDPPNKAVGAITGQGQNALQNLASNENPLDSIVKFAWSGYGVSLLMLTSFWLGEHRKMQQMSQLQRRTHH
jgi:hypothetical protein